MMKNPLPCDLHKCHELVWKCVKIELLSVSCMNNVKRLTFLLCLHIKDLMLHCSRHDFFIFGEKYQNGNYFLVTNLKQEREKNLQGRPETSLLCSNNCETSYIYIYIYIRVCVYVCAHA